MSEGAPAAARAQVIAPFVLVTLIWGSTWYVITSQLRFLPAGWAITWRFALAALAMLAVATWRREPMRIGAAGQRLALAVGVTQFTLNYVFVYGAEAHIASGLVALVSALLIVPNALMGQVFLKRAVSPRFWLGSAVAIAGLALLFGHELTRHQADAHRIALGIILSLGGVISASTANVLQAVEAIERLPRARMLALAMAYGTALDAIVAFATDGAPTLPLDATFLAGLAYLAVVGSAVTFTLYFGLIRAIGPAQAGYIGVLTPVIAMLLSTLFENYRWSVAAGLGVALALAGLVIALSARSPSRQLG